MRLLPLFLALLCAAPSAFASEVTVPEIDGYTAMSALTLIAGGVLVLRSRRSK